MKPKPIHVCCNEDLGNGHGGGEWDEEKIGDDGEVLKVGWFGLLTVRWVHRFFSGQKQGALLKGISSNNFCVVSSLIAR